MKVLNSIQVKDIQSKNLAKKLNYSISLISLEAATNEIADQSNDAVSEVIKENKKDLDNIFGNGKASQKIAAIIKKHI